MSINDFYTLKGYSLLEDEQLTPAMEDYLEMVCRISPKNSPVHIRDLSRMLNVRPPSASKMIKRLGLLGYLNTERYGSITLTAKGSAIGGYLLKRHRIVHNFLCFINGSDNELEEAEKIEHFLSRRTVENMDRFLNDLNR